MIIIDVRTGPEFDGSHLEGAIQLDYYGEDFIDQLARLDRHKSYLIYCREGNRSGHVVEIMESLGFTDVADLHGGLQQWVDSHLPTTTT